jgi:hypothetical protein
MVTIAYWESDNWWFNESYQGFYHCRQPAYWEGDNVYCSKCQQEMGEK